MPRGKRGTRPGFVAFWREGRPCAQVVTDCPDCRKSLGSPGEAHECERRVPIETAVKSRRGTETRG